MNHQTPFWKLALGGVIAGAAIYFFPFIVPAIAFVFVMGLLFRLFFGFWPAGAVRTCGTRTQRTGKA
ncbi:MAG: hypothetical protein IPN38_16005 [Flavobacteriales bacterium]|nr:hypothetical protein [Flavobacteriales bacterium]